MTAKYVVGIDLGTTNTVVAFAPIDVKRKSPPVPAIFEVPQLTANREIEDRPLLPSALYAPLSGEVNGDPDWVVGELAKRRGSEVTGRFVASAKSWLSHAAVDRVAAILPWGSTDESAPKLSPVDASTRILTHIRKAWDDAHNDAPLAEQEVVLTLPASFDDVARELTLQAAKDAGISPSLLEEPTAAFYDAMRDAKTMRALARSGDGQEQLVLVVDVGGGTTDLSLMAVGPDPEKKRGAFAVRRVAVGRHILLGGDNMDLALAHLAEPRIATGGAAKLEAVELAQLVHGCRDAKERILSGDADEARVTVLGRGSRLVGGARGTTLKREEVERIVLGGFFPEVKDEGAEPQKRRAAIVAFGLPYERDPAITRHVKQFLARHSADKAPDALLLNGGVFNAPPIVDALVDAIGAPEVLPSADPDLAVAKGAVLYAFARRGIGIRVESGASRGYYIAVAEPKHAVCILPRGAAEGVRHEAGGRTFDLVVGRTVRFDLFSSDVRDDEAGTIVTNTDDEEAFERLPPVVARLPSSGKNEQSVPVVLGGELLSTGQLELACAEKNGERRFRLEFQLREGGGSRTSLAPTPSSLAPAPPSGTHAATSGKLVKGIEVLDHVFGKRTDATPREVKDVVRDLEKVLNNRLTWTMETCRALADRLLANPGARRRSPNHERAFFLLLGFCMRPGFGDPGDPSRIQRAWPLFDGRLGFPNEAPNWQQFFIAFRRMSGGLSAEMQTAIRDAMDAVIAPKDAGLKPPKRMPEGIDELIVLLASLERVPASRRTQLGEWLLERTWTDSDALIWTAIGRVGARAPLFASVHHVVPPKIVEPWIERLLRLDWTKVSSAAHASVQLARVTGDRARDVQERIRKEVEKRLATIGARDAWVRAVRELVDVNEEERVAILGDGLPIGLRLAAVASGS
jgi:molecular chaperone DnaK (HSP70)